MWQFDSIPVVRSWSYSKRLFIQVTSPAASYAIHLIATTWNGLPDIKKNIGENG